MTNYRVLLIVFAVVPSSLYTVTAEESCNSLGVFFYEEMGCIPKYLAGKKCPVSYECTKYKDENTCFFQGKIYKNGEKVDVSDTGYNCNLRCICRGKNKITCGGVIDCIPDFHPNENCYWRKDDFKYCCFEQVCEPFPSNVTCDFAGKTYKDGEIMLPTNECKRCLCKRDFREESCIAMNCGFELFNAEKIQNYCAPAYRKDRGDTLCCPVDFVCPSDKDQIIPSGNTSDVKCKYGDKLLNIGDSFEARASRIGQVACKCLLPPYVTCS